MGGGAQEHGRTWRHAQGAFKSQLQEMPACNPDPWGQPLPLSQWTGPKLLLGALREWNAWCSRAKGHLMVYRASRRGSTCLQLPRLRGGGDKRGRILPAGGSWKTRLVGMGAQF